MNQQLEDLMHKAGLTAQGCWDEMDQYDRAAIMKFAELIVEECLEIVEDEDDGSRDTLAVRWAMHRMKKHFGFEERKQIGWIEREEGFYKLYEPPKGSVVTRTFVLCRYCSEAIYHCTGPKSDAVCFACYNKDPEMR